MVGFKSGRPNPVTSPGRPGQKNNLKKRQAAYDEARPDNGTKRPGSQKK